MSTLGLGLAAGLYVLTALDQFSKGEPWMALAFLAYAVANCGFIGAMR